MKILYIAHCRCMYGANRALLALLENMRRRPGTELLVMLPAEIDGDFAEVLDERGIRYFVGVFHRWSDTAGKRLRRVKGIYRCLCNVWEIRTIGRRLQRENVDLIHSNSGTIQIGAMLAERYGVPHIWHVRELMEEHYHVENIYPRGVSRRLLQNSFAVIAISSAVANKITKKYPNVPIRIVGDGVEWKEEAEKNGNRDETLQAQFGNEKGIRFVCVGVLSEGKGQKDILKACALLHGAGTEEYRVHFIGAEGEAGCEKELLTYAEENGLRDNVRFWGYREDISALLPFMDVGITASHMEAFGLATAEYMLAGLPVLGSDSGATPELLEEGKSGFLFPYGDPEGLAQRMKYCIEHRDIVADMGSYARDSARKRFSVEKNADTVYEIYREALKA